MKLFKAVTTVQGSLKLGPYTDWIEAESLEQAKVKFDSESETCGLPMDSRRLVVYTECNPETLKPL